MLSGTREHSIHLYNGSSVCMLMFGTGAPMQNVAGSDAGLVVLDKQDVGWAGWAGLGRARRGEVTGGGEEGRAVGHAPRSNRGVLQQSLHQSRRASGRLGCGQQVHVPHTIHDAICGAATSVSTGVVGRRIRRSEPRAWLSATYLSKRARSRDSPASARAREQRAAAPHRSQRSARPRLLQSPPGASRRLFLSKPSVCIRIEHAFAREPVEWLLYRRLNVSLT